MPEVEEEQKVEQNGQPLPGGFTKKEEWECEACTFLNTVTDWCDMRQGKCEICQTPNRDIKSCIALAKKQKKAEVAP